MNPKLNKLLKVLLVIWLVLGFLLMIYVVFFYKKSAFVPALIFLAGFLAIALPLRKMEEQKRSAEQEEEENS
ncbi:MAG: hypothetical protein E7449_06290 [Ruminococcaceae bacterium]|nr:hypothetical protein [Oscillospiraceae bacterium]